MASWNRNISMRALRAFHAAADRNSFREAAENLYLTASAVSHQIKHLESEMGVRLFARNSRGLSLTANGREFYEDLQPILAALDTAIAEHSANTERSNLRISVSPFFASELLVPQLPDFTARYPGLDINVDTGDLISESADASIRLGQNAPKSEDYDELFRLRLAPVGTPELYDSVVVKAGKITSDFPIIVHDSRPSAWKQWQRSSRIRLPSSPKTLRLDSMIAVARAAERGLGAALVPVQLFDRWLESGSLVQLFDHQLTTREAYYFLTHSDREKNPAIDSLRQWVLQDLVPQQ